MRHCFWRRFTINLTGVTNAQRLGVTLSNVTVGARSGDITIPMGVLLGDTTANGTVNAGDVSQTKAQSGQPVGAGNFRTDVTVERHPQRIGCQLGEERTRAPHSLRDSCETELANKGEPAGRWTGPSSGRYWIDRTPARESLFGIPSLVRRIERLLAGSAIGRERLGLIFHYRRARRSRLPRNTLALCSPCSLRWNLFPAFLVS